MLSISNGPHSLLENLKLNNVDNPGQYLSFCSLRNHDELAGKLVGFFNLFLCENFVFFLIYFNINFYVFTAKLIFFICLKFLFCKWFFVDLL